MKNTHIRSADFKFKITFYADESKKCEKDIKIEEIKTEDPSRPSYKLPDLLDPSTGQNVKFEVTIPDILKDIMAYDAPFI